MNLSLEIMANGRQANRTGNSLEEFVEHHLNLNKYIKEMNLLENAIRLRDERHSNSKLYARKVLCGKTIYNTDRYCDFLVINKQKFPNDLIIECKWQQAGGSVDEKYPYLYLNIIELGIPTIILIDGGGYKDGALRWLKKQVDSLTALIGVYSMAEFQALVNKEFL